MKQKGLMKRVGAVLMAAALTISTFPQIHTNVYATENQLPTKEQFATVDELRNFDTNDGTENKAAKVYFGNNNQQWWIAGSQDGNLTLFATAPVLENQRFNGDSHKSDTQNYDLTWNCDYEDVNPENNEVYVNHYGGSKMRQAILKEVEDLLFTAKEKEYINTTPIYTNDNKNYNWQYKTNDRLYLANMDSSNNTLYVGKTIRYTYDTGLRIDESYFKNINDFWTRRPGRRLSPKDVVVVSNGQRVIRNIYDQYAVVPAFELNLSSAIFASAAPAATSDGKLSENDAFTLRYQSQKDIGEAAISKSKENIAVTNVKNENTYLVVQNSQGAWSKKVSSNDLVFASDIDSSLTSFENCKVWLETTSDRITYAKEAIQGSGHNVKVNIGENLIVNGGNILQTNVSGNITEITIKVNDGYYLPDGYTDTIYGLNGLNVKDVTQTSFTISGTPTSDVNITLPAATVLPKSAIPEVTISKTKASITATVTNHKTKFGDIEYKWNDGKWEQNKNTLSNLQADTTYKLAVRFTGKGIYQPSDEYSVDITTLKDGNTVIVVPTGLTTTYKEGLKLSEIAFPADSGWSWVDGNAALSAGTKSYLASFDTTSLESTTDFSNVEGYDSNTHKVTKNVEVKVDKADSAVTITTQSLNKAYDGNAVSVPKYTTSGSDGKVTIKWQENTGSADTPKWEDLKSAPSKVGTYRVVIELAGNDNYKPASATLDFTISKADNAWAKELSIKGWKYNETANVPTAKAQFGDVKFTYSSEENGTYTSEVPKNAGTYYVKASVVGTAKYTGLESAPVSFEIKKADSSIKFKDGVAFDKVYDTNAIVVAEEHLEKTGSTGKVSFIFEKKVNDEWKNVETPTEAGTYRVTANLAGDDNYTSATSKPLEFTISKADSAVTITTQSLNKAYDGNAVSVPKYTTSGSDGKVTIKWQENTGSADTPKWEDLKSAPSKVGTYRVVIELAGNDNYKPASATLDFAISKADNAWAKELSITGWTYNETANVPTAKAQFGDVTFTYSNEENGTYTSEVPKNAGTYYVKATVAGTKNYTGLESAPVSFEIKKADSSIKFKDGVAFDKVYDTNAIVVAEEHLEKTGSTGKVSFIFEKKVNDEWKNVETPTEAGTYRVTANLAGDDNYTSATSKPLEFTISKADSAVTITTQSLNKAYDGNAVSVPKYTTSGSDGKVTIKWQENTGSADTPKWEDLKSAPSKVGTYRVVIELAGNDNYKPASATLDFTISKADNAWAKELSIKGWKYNETANVPTAKAQFGDVKFTYSSEENGTYTSEVPKNAGTYYVKASVAGTENYTGLESAPVAFEIAKAIPSYEKVTGLVLGQGQALSKIELPEQFKWVDETMTADELGTHTCKAIYTPEDTSNYQTIEVKVVPTPVANNHVPTINASDKTITVGDKFEPLKDVIANDKEDGDLTSKIKVIKNTVDTKKAGTYEVTYQVTDSQGATVTKTIKVTVKTAPVNPDKDKPNNGKGNVETRDQTNVGLFTTLSIISALGIAILAIWKKKR